MKRIVSMCVLGLALIACGQQSEPIAEVVPVVVAEQPSGPCETSGRTYAQAYGTIAQVVADVELSRAAFIQQDNARGPGSEEIPTGTRGKEKIRVCVYDGDFESADSRYSTARSQRVSLIIEPSGFIWMRAIGKPERVTVPTAE